MLPAASFQYCVNGTPTDSELARNCPLRYAARLVSGANPFHLAFRKFCTETFFPFSTMATCSPTAFDCHVVHISLVRILKQMLRVAAMGIVACVTYLKAFNRICWMDQHPRNSIGRNASLALASPTKHGIARRDVGIPQPALVSTSFFNMRPETHFNWWGFCPPFKRCVAAMFGCSAFGFSCASQPSNASKDGGGFVGLHGINYAQAVGVSL